MDPTTRHRLLDALEVLDARVLRLRSEAEFAGVTRHGTHNQKDHGRRGPGKVKAAVAAVTGKSFTDNAAGRAFIQGHFGDWHAGLSRDEDKALSFWQSPGFELMNGQLRGNTVKAPSADLARARKASKDLKAAIKRSPPLPEPVTVFRGFSASQFDLTPGAVVTDPGFVSFALTSDGVAAVARHGKPAVAKIVLPKGMRVGAGQTRELIGQPGTKFRIVKVRDGGKVTQIEMEAILP
jgi:hypothetical protein